MIDAGQFIEYRKKTNGQMYGTTYEELQNIK